MPSILQVLQSPLGRRILSYYFTSVSLSALLTSYSEKYLYNKYIMPYLRGSKSTLRYAGPPTLANRLTRIERQVRRNKPELIEFRRNITVTSGIVGGNVEDFDATADVIALSSFRDNITGDQWWNKYLRLKFHTNAADITVARLVVYIPERADSVWAPSSTHKYTSMPDISAYKVLFDKTYHPNHPNNAITSVDNGSLFDISAFVKLRGLTEYNSGASSINKNPVKYTLIYNSQRSGVSAWQHTYGLGVCNK